MSKRLIKAFKLVLCYIVIASMVVTLMPLSASPVSAASFDPDKRVTDVKVASKSFDYVQIRWDKIPGATGYKLYRATSENGDYERVAVIDSTSFKIKAPMNKTRYYKVRAYHKSSSGKVRNGKYSRVLAAMATLPDPKLSLTPSTDYFKLEWNGVPWSNGYKVYRSTSRNGKYSVIATTKGHTFKNTSIKKGKYYYYKVRAFKEMDNGKNYYGEFSKVRVGITKRPSPKNFNVVAEGNGLKITFRGVSHCNGYKIYRSDSKDGPYKKIVTTKYKDYTDTNITKGKRYYYKAKAYIRLNSKIYYGYTSDIDSGIYNPKSQPPTLSVRPKTDYIKLSWTKNEKAVGYQIYRATSKDGDYDLLAEPKGTTFKNTSVNAGTFYYYKVRAVMGSGSTKYSSFSTPKTGVTIPKAPTSVKAVSKTSGIKLTWNASKNCVGYQIFRATSKDGDYKKVGSTKETSFLDTNSLTKKKKYYYKVRGYYYINRELRYGFFNYLSASRDAVVKVAVGWYGCRESNGSHKKIIDIYNDNLAPGCGKVPYSAPWCATFVSAVGIKAKATKIIVRHSYCPSMMGTYKSRKQYSSSKNYTPSPGDIIFYDWNYNGVPDHVGMIVSCKGNTVTAIEGNQSDAVRYREFTKGYRYILSYGLPDYDESSAITYTGANTSSVAEEELESAGISTSGEPMGYSEMGEEYDEAEEALSVGCGEDATEMEQMEVMIETMKTHAKTSGLERCSETEYYAAFLYRLCADADINACIVTTEGENGEKASYLEVTLDDELYKVDPAEDNCKPVPYTPEVTDYEGAE